MNEHVARVVGAYHFTRSLYPCAKVERGGDIPEAADKLASRVKALWRAHRGNVWVFIDTLGRCYVLGELHTSRARLLADRDAYLIGVYAGVYGIGRRLAAMIAEDLAAHVLEP